MDRDELEVLSKDELIDLILRMQDEKPIGWDTLRELVWERDGPYCQVCGLFIPESAYHCGHLVDRMAGGLDTLDNLTVMDRVCNIRKPVHYSKDEYHHWLKEGYWADEWLVEFKEYIMGLNARIMKRFGEPAIDPIPDDTKMLQIFRYQQMLDLGLVKRSKEFDYETLPEWKKHGSSY